eukprot:TRINITY_DN2463_c0_g1_i1.p1 TRINITY_DN2463_c0_g1~~TRINITY_DN2463_c0_g1_i1.p1  ORF type:complete len:322 (-),score=51.55 TRINITY_DN2463_c0_g1_i1:147-1112(-)
MVFSRFPLFQFLFLLLSLNVADTSGSPEVCGIPKLADSVLGSKPLAPIYSLQCFSPRSRVTEVDEQFLERASNILQQNDVQMAVLFYAQWCPFSRSFRPMFDVLSAMFPRIYHFSVDEAVVRPSMLSRYGVHSFPALILQNHLGKVSYHGARDYESLIHFYINMTGVEPLSPVSKEDDPGTILSPFYTHQAGEERSHCPYSWAKSADRLLQQDMYLTLAVLFLTMRVLYLLYPTCLLWLKFVWERCVSYDNRVILRNNPTFVENMLSIVNLRRAFRSLRLYKKGNLQEGAINATAWASKSLAHVSLGEGSSSKILSGSEGQ